MSLQQLPSELISLTLSNLDGKDLLKLAQCNTYFHQKIDQDSFWHDLCNLNGIHYCDPCITWKELYCSGSLSKMCPHLHKSMLNPSLLQQKKRILWSRIQPLGDQILCLQPECNYFGEAQDHNDGDKHHIILKLSPLNSFRVWCKPCKKTFGFNGFSHNINFGLQSEQCMMQEMIHPLTVALPTDTAKLTASIISGRKMIERDVFETQFRFATTHIIEKSWHTKWIEFISGTSNGLPGQLTNEKLLRSDGSLDPKLILGKDFELVSSLARWYIERVYGVFGTIISADQLKHDPEYCKLTHMMNIRQQINRVSHFSSHLMARH